VAAEGGAGRWRGFAARYAPAIAAAAAMTVIGVWGLARDSAMGNDEVVSRWAALLSLRQLAHLVRHVDAVHGLYYLLLHGWMAVGTSPVAMRVPSVISMVAAVALVAILARRLTGSGWAALFAGLVTALTPSISYYAQTARSYAFVFACVVAGTLVLLRAMQAEAAGAPHAQLRRRWLAYGALVVLAGYLNEMSLLVLAAHLITILLARQGRQTVKHWLLTSAAAAVLVAPLLAVSIRQDRALVWISRPGLRDLWILYHDYFGATIWAPLLLAACAVVALLPGRGAQAEAAWWRGGGISVASVAAPLLVLPAAVLLIESLIGPPLYVDRYVLYGEAGAALLAGAGIYRIGQWLAGRLDRRAIVWVPGVVVCVLALVLQLGAQQRTRQPGSRLYNFGGPAFFIGAHARPGDGVLFFDDFFRKAELGYPSQFHDVGDLALAVSPAVANPFKGIDKPFPAIASSMLSHHRIWVIGRRPTVAVQSRQLRAERALLLRNFTEVFEHGFRGMWLTLWVRR
jgi:mannosyltransferase